jgi:hypothetical protein
VSAAAPVRTSLAEGAYPVARASTPSAPAVPGTGAEAPRATNPLEARVAALEAEVARLGNLYRSLAGETPPR